MLLTPPTEEGQLKAILQLLNSFFIFGATYLYLLAVLLALRYFLPLPRQKKKEIVLFGLITLPVMYVISKLAGLLYYDPRPFVASHVPPLIPHEPDNGFPSDHVLLLSAIASILFPFSRKTSATVFSLAILVGIARVYAGIHHPIDVLGSMIIALGIST